MGYNGFMKIPAVVLVFICLLSLRTIVQAAITNEIRAESSGGSVSVEVNNQVNTGNYSKTTTTTTGKTNIEIHQTGDGTSSVNINGKEWKLEGPGDISVQEDGAVNATRTPTPTAPIEEQEQEETLFESLRENLEKLKETIENLIDSIFGE